MDNLSIMGKKFIIGLTGNIATGKSAVMQMAAQRGAFTIDADQVVHEILNSNLTVQRAIGRAFGSDVLLEDGRINRPALGKIVFNDSLALKRLEEIVHPAVYDAVVDMLANTEAAIVMYEAIKLLESKFRSHCDQIWVTTCSQQTQLDRLKKYRGMDEETGRERINAQAPQVEKIAAADIVIDTDGSMSETEAQFLKAWSGIKLEARLFINRN